MKFADQNSSMFVPGAAGNVSYHGNYPSILSTPDGEITHPDLGRSNNGQQAPSSE
jgi:hypothetical protein